MDRLSSGWEIGAPRMASSVTATERCPPREQEEPRIMVLTPPEDQTPRPSRVIAEALVKRHGPYCIVTQASKLGLAPELTRAMVVACSATALDAVRTPRKRTVAAS